MKVNKKKNSHRRPKLPEVKWVSREEAEAIRAEWEKLLLGDHVVFTEEVIGTFRAKDEKLQLGIAERVMEEDRDVLGYLQDVPLSFADRVMGQWETVGPLKPIPGCTHKPPHMTPQEEEICAEIRVPKPLKFLR